MSARGQWVFDLDTGGKKIPETVKRDIEKRVRLVAEKEFQGRYNRLKIRFRGQFCYMDAYTEPGSLKIGHRQTGRRPKKHTWKGCATLLCTSAGCVTLATTNGALPFTPTATRSTNFLYIRMVPSSELQKKRSSHPEWFT